MGPRNPHWGLLHAKLLLAGQPLNDQLLRLEDYLGEISSYACSSTLALGSRVGNRILGWRDFGLSPRDPSCSLALRFECMHPSVH